VTDPETMLVIVQCRCKQYASSSPTSRLLSQIWLLPSCCFHSKNMPLSA